MNDSLTPRPEHHFTFGLWTVGNPGRDPFGHEVRPQLEQVGVATQEFARRDIGILRGAAPPAAHAFDLAVRVIPLDLPGTRIAGAQALHRALHADGNVGRLRPDR